MIEISMTFLFEAPIPSIRFFSWLVQVLAAGELDAHTLRLQLLLAFA